jgi:hypothetical protein
MVEPVIFLWFSEELFIWVPTPTFQSLSSNWPIETIDVHRPIGLLTDDYSVTKPSSHVEIIRRKTRHLYYYVFEVFACKIIETWRIWSSLKIRRILVFRPFNWTQILLSLQERLWIMAISHLKHTVNKTDTARTTLTLRRVLPTIVAVDSLNYYILWVYVCSLRYPACNVHESYYLYIVISGVPDCTIYFFYIIS